jgi:hypothetical protein
MVPTQPAPRKPGAALLHEQFLSILPNIVAHGRFYFRRFKRADRREDRCR